MPQSFVRCALVAAGLVVAVSAAQAQSSTAATTYSDMQGAIVAAQLCKNAKFSRTDFSKLNAAIDGQVKFDIGAGERLTIIEKAKSKIGAAVSKNGCGDPTVTSALSLYDTRLQSALK